MPAISKYSSLPGDIAEDNDAKNNIIVSRPLSETPRNAENKYFLEMDGRFDQINPIKQKIADEVINISISKPANEKTYNPEKNQEKSTYPKPLNKKRLVKQVQELPFLLNWKPQPPADKLDYPVAAQKFVTRCMIAAFGDVMRKHIPDNKYLKYAIRDLFKSTATLKLKERQDFSKCYDAVKKHLGKQRAFFCNGMYRDNHIVSYVIKKKHNNYDVQLYNGDQFPLPEREGHYEAIPVQNFTVPEKAFQEFLFKILWDNDFEKWQHLYQKPTSDQPKRYMKRQNSQNCAYHNLVEALRGHIMSMPSGEAHWKNLKYYFLKKLTADKIVNDYSFGRTIIS